MPPFSCAATAYLHKKMFGQNSFFPNNPQQGSSSQPSSQPAKPASTGTATGFDQNNIQQQTPGFQPFSQNSNNSNPSFAFNLPNPVDSGAKPGKSNPLFGNSNTTAPVFVQQPRQATFDFGKPAQTTNNGFGGSPVGRDKPGMNMLLISSSVYVYSTS